MSLLNTCWDQGIAKLEEKKAYSKVMGMQPVAIVCPLEFNIFTCHIFVKSGTEKKIIHMKEDPYSQNQNNFLVPA